MSFSFLSDYENLVGKFGKVACRTCLTMYKMSLCQFFMILMMLCTSITPYGSAIMGHQPMYHHVLTVAPFSVAHRGLICVPIVSQA